MSQVKESKEDAFKRISTDIMRLYNEKMFDYLSTQDEGSITDADVIILIMNLTITTGINIYYSLKTLLPTTTIDFDFIKVKVINSFVDQFDKIKEFKPTNETMPLTVEQVKEVFEKGSAVISMPDGSMKKITKDDILVKKEDLEKIINSHKGEIIDPNTKKIIIPGGKIL